MGSRKSETFFALVILQLSIFSGINVASAASDEQNLEVLIENFNAQDVNVKEDSVIEPLIKLLTDEEWKVESAATNALVEIALVEIALVEILH